MCRTPLALLLALSAQLLGACTESAHPAEPEPPPAKGDSASTFPGYDPPKVSLLVKEAMRKAEPKQKAEPYAPRQVDVPEIVPAHPELLPRTKTGEPLLGAVSGAALVVDVSLADPITAAAKCMQLTTSCIQAPTVKSARDRDSCVASARTCEDNHPWDQELACCPSACKEVYAELRKADYSMFEAWTLTRTGNCFPGLIEFMAAAKAASEGEP